MRELQLVLSDDLDYARTGERVAADETVVIALDGKTRELDLTAVHAKELRRILGPYMEAGHDPAAATAGQDRKPPKSPAHRAGAPVFGYAQLRESRKWHQQLRDWADANGITSEDGKRPPYRTKSNAWYYPSWLVERYLAENPQ